MRNRRRSLILIAAIAMGLWAGIFLMAFYNGVIEQRIRIAIARELSHIQIHHPSFSDEHEMKFFMKDAESILSESRRDPNIKAITGRMVTDGMIMSPYGSDGITINGIVPHEEQKMTGLEDKLTEGKYFDPGKNNQIIISGKLAKKLKIGIGNKVVVTVQDMDDELVSIAFRVCGLFKTNNGPYDDRMTFVMRDELGKQTGMLYKINEIGILLHESKMLEPILLMLKGQYPELSSKSWMEISPELGLTVKAGDQMMVVFMSIILLALSFGIINTMMMSVLERTRELGMLAALGMGSGRIFRMVMTETLCMVATSCLPGMIMGYATIYISRIRGINMEFASDVYSSFGFDPLIFPSATPVHLYRILMLVSATAFISGVFPALRAIRIQPAAALKN